MNLARVCRRSPTFVPCQRTLTRLPEAPVRVHNAIDIGLIIRERRRKLGLDQGELARRIKVSRQWVLEVEKGKPRAKIGFVLRARDAMKATAN